MQPFAGLRTLDSLEDLAGKRVFVRVDFNVPFDKKSGAISDDERIRAALPTLQYLEAREAKVVLASHLGRPKPGTHSPSLEPCGARLAELLGVEVILPEDCIGDTVQKLVRELRPRQVCLLENLRFHAEEEANDEGFARALAKLCDVYVNDAFGAAHRAHASVDALPRLVRERAMGFLMQKELTNLARVVEQVERPFVAVLGGAKVADKIGIIEKLLEKCDALCIGGAMANTLLAARECNLQASRVETDWLAPGRTLLEKAERKGVRLLLPSDVVVGTGLDATTGTLCSVNEIPAGTMALDVGPDTVRRFERELQKAKTIFWNGPMGLFENPAFATGTKAVAELVARSPGFSVIGGGDSAAAIRELEPELVSQIDFISTGGGAALELIEGKRLPGVEALKTSG